jgi:hypothetical protein
MHARHYLYSLGLLLVVGLGFVLFLPGAHPLANSGSTTKWEYSVTDLDQDHCSSGNLSLSLADAGQLGWELVSYERQAGDNSILIAPAASSYGKETNPPIADSLVGTIKAGEPGGCRLVFKRPG